MNPKDVMVFKYSGSKRTLLPLMRKLPTYVRAVEPYCGGGSFLLASQKSGLGIDANPDLIALWNWLRDEATPDVLRDLERLRHESVDAAPDGKPSVRDLNLEKGPETYLRINAASVVVGQLSSWKLYPQHRLPVENTIAMLPRLQNLRFLCGDASLYLEQQQDGDLVFVDPPYFGTTGNYKAKGLKIECDYRPKDTIELISRIDAPIILTYGTDAPTVFPDFNWEVLMTKKVPNMRRGGTVDRIEHVAYINWPA